MSVMVREEPLFKILLNSPKLFLYQSELQDVMSQEQQKRDAFYAWITEDTRTEFINGERVMQSPAKHRHTMASVNLTTLLSTYVDLHEMGVVGAETMLVTLTRNDYLPDICFFRKGRAAEIVFDQMKYPAPDFIIEILSPSTERIDRGTKFEDYAAHGVEEYWLVNPEDRVVEQYRLIQNRYHLQERMSEGEISSIVVNGFKIPVAAIFDKEVKNQILGSFGPPVEHQQWMAQWRGAAQALQEQKETDLATMTLSEAQIATTDLLSFPVRMIDRDSPRWSFSGLVKQQEYFMKTFRSV